MISDLRSETKGSQFDCTCKHPANACEAGGSGRKELMKLPLSSLTVLGFLNVRERIPR